MAKEILRCQVCKQYSLKKIHCNKKTITTKPAKYSPEDKMGHYRRIYKEKNKHNSKSNSAPAE